MSVSINVSNKKVEETCNILMQHKHDFSWKIIANYIHLMHSTYVTLVASLKISHVAESFSLKERRNFLYFLQLDNCVHEFLIAFHAIHGDYLWEHKQN
jgi:hypothetical protein